MGRLLESLRAETRHAATSATLATNPAKCRNVASVATGHDSKANTLLAAFRAEGSPDKWLGLDHGDISELTDGVLRTYALMLAVDAERQAGRVPAGETARALCRHCGPVWLHPAVAAVAPVVSGWPQVLGCPWCHVRGLGGYIPRPQVTCGECSNFSPDAVNPDGGAGTCRAEVDPDRPWPKPQRQCQHYLPSVGTYWKARDE